MIVERDTYGVHQIKLGFTAWAQNHGRDELEIEKKVKLDIYYLKHFGLWIDFKCFFGTIISVFKSNGVVEGGTDEIYKKATEANTKPEKKTDCNYKSFVYVLAV